MDNKTVKININDNYRLVVISDVHGNKEMLIKLLDKVALKDEDHLIILGDFINRGLDSYNTYHFVKELEKRKNTIILKGNHESFMQRHLEVNEYSDEFLDFLKHEYYETLIGELIKKSGNGVQSIKSSQEMINMLGSERLEIRDYLATLPILAYFDDMVFVHGGFNEDYTIEENETDYLKYDFYNEVAKPNKKLTVVGHWPVSELRDDQLTNLPFYNDSKNIISIDGGMGAKSTGELNALVIEKTNGNVIHKCVQANNFERKVVQKASVFENEPWVYLNYPKSDFEVLSKGEKWSRCKRISNGKEFKVFTSLLKKKHDGYSMDVNYINKYLNLNIGDEVDLCCTFDDYVLVKHKDEFGWLESSQIS